MFETGSDGRRREVQGERVNEEEGRHNYEGEADDHIMDGSYHYVAYAHYVEGRSWAEKEGRQCPICNNANCANQTMPIM